VYLPAAEVRRPGFWPRVCVRHGRPVTGTRKVTLYSKPPLWTMLLFFVVLAFALIVMLASRRSIKIPALPVCERCQAERRVRIGIGWGLVVLGLVAVARMAEPQSWIAAAILIVAGCLFLSQGSWAVLFSADVSSDGGHIRLRKAPRAFLAALPLPEWAGAEPVAAPPPPPPSSLGYFS
jgi:hypothetical protein